MELTPKEQHIFDTIEATYHFFQQETAKEEDMDKTDIATKMGIRLFQMMLEIELQSAKEYLLFAKNETNLDDTLVGNLARLFCSGQKSDFLLAKQIMIGLVLSEKVFIKLVEKIYNHYLDWKGSNFYAICFLDLPPTLERLRGIAQLAAMDDNTEADKKLLATLEVKTKKNLVNLFYLSIIGDGEVSSVWLV